MVADVREFMGRKVYDTIIPRNVRVSEAPSYGKPVLVYDLKCAGSEAYLRLATEIIQREKEMLQSTTEDRGRMTNPSSMLVRLSSRRRQWRMKRARAWAAGSRR